MLWHTHPLCFMLGELDVDDQRHNRPWLSALVVSDLRGAGDNPGMPGDGFFKALEGARGIDVKVKITVWVKELNAVRKHYRGR